VIMDLHSGDEEGLEDWVDPEGRLAAIIPIRTELAEGDLRPLYLAWLLVAQDRTLDDDELEPPVPPGLRELSGPQAALADFMRLDPDLLAAAAEASEPLTAATPSAAVLKRWVRELATADKDELLLRVLRGEGALLRSELLRSFHGETEDRTVDGSRRVSELLAAGEKAWAKRQEAQRKRETAERQRREQKAAEARAKRVQALASNPTKAWKQVDALIATKKPKEYDAAVTLLLDLQAVDTRAFKLQMGRLRAQHARKPSLIDRFDRARFP
jgi:FtsZ-interacting cell division protein YlmF